VRGYGLTDSARVAARPGQRLDLAATPAPDPATAASVYPAAYLYAMMSLPTEAETASLPNGRNEYLMWVKNMGCVGCHQLGQLSTRTLPPSLGKFNNSHDAWLRRISSGQAGNNMIQTTMGTLGGLPLKYLSDWTDRVALGELPAQHPVWPQGLERNVAATVRDWLTDQHYLHDLSGTDRRNPTVNGYGPLYGAPELSTDDFPVLDPRTHTATTFRAPVRDEDTPTTNDDPVIAPSPYWGDARIWDSRANAHNPMLDARGRVWYTARIRAAANPAFCRRGSDHPSAKAFPVERSGRQLSIYEPDTKKYTFVDTCYGTHHLQFAYDDPNDTLWTSGGGQVIGWLNTKQFDATGDAAASQGWQGAVERTGRDGRSLSRRLDAARAAGAGVQGSAGVQRRIQLLHLGGPARHAGTGQGCADRHGEPVRRGACARGGTDGDAAHSVSAGVLHEGNGGPHR
jgi:hypothetical protein